MRKIILALAALSLTNTTVMAQPYGQQPNPYRDHRGSNAAPIIIGVLVGVIIGASVANVERDNRQVQEEPRYQEPPAPYNVQRRPEYNQQPTARCVDGTLSYSYHDRGTCSHHGGVRYWF